MNRYMRTVHNFLIDCILKGHKLFLKGQCHGQNVMGGGEDKQGREDDEEGRKDEIESRKDEEGG